MGRRRSGGSSEDDEPPQQHSSPSQPDSVVPWGEAGVSKGKACSAAPSTYYGLWVLCQMRVVLARRHDPIPFFSAGLMECGGVPVIWGLFVCCTPHVRKGMGRAPQKLLFGMAHSEAYQYRLTSVIIVWVLEGGGVRCICK